MQLSLPSASKPPPSKSSRGCEVKRLYPTQDEVADQIGNVLGLFRALAILLPADSPLQKLAADGQRDSKILVDSVAALFAHIDFAESHLRLMDEQT